jgi:hypothetical protein
VAERIILARDHQRGAADRATVGGRAHAVGHRVEGLLVVDPRHVHEHLLEARGGLLEDRDLRSVAGVGGGERPHARFDGRKARPPVGAEAGAAHADALRVDLRAAHQVVDKRLRRALVVVRPDPDLAEVADALARAVDGEDVHPAAWERVAEGAREGLLRHVHPGNEEDGRRAAPAAQKMQPGLNLHALPRDLHRLDVGAAERHDPVEAGHVQAVQRDLLGVVILEDRVLRAAVGHGRPPAQPGGRPAASTASATSWQWRPTLWAGRGIIRQDLTSAGTSRSSLAKFCTRPVVLTIRR